MDRVAELALIPHLPEVVVAMSLDPGCRAQDCDIIETVGDPARTEGWHILLLALAHGNRLQLRDLLPQVAGHIPAHAEILEVLIHAVENGFLGFAADDQVPAVLDEREGVGAVGQVRFEAHGRGSHAIASVGRVLRLEPGEPLVLAVVDRQPHAGDLLHIVHELLRREHGRLAELVRQADIRACLAVPDEVRLPPRRLRQSGERGHGHENAGSSQLSHVPPPSLTLRLPDAHLPSCLPLDRAVQGRYTVPSRGPVRAASAPHSTRM